MNKNTPALVFCVAALMLSGCGMSEDNDTTHVEDIPQAAISAAERAKLSIENASSGVNQAVSDAMEKARELMASKRYKEALAALDSLSQYTLTQKQIDAVTQLRQQIQSAMK